MSERLYFAYANLEMTRRAQREGALAYTRKHFIHRAKAYSQYQAGTRSPASLVRDDTDKLRRGEICAYCGAAGRTTSDHILPKSRGGPDVGDNIVRSCRKCNSRKGAKDIFEFYSFQADQIFPPLFLVRTYLKLALLWSIERGIMTTRLEELDLATLPFRPDLIPGRFPLTNEPS